MVFVLVMRSMVGKNELTFLSVIIIFLLLESFQIEAVEFLTVRYGFYNLKFFVSILM